MSSKEISIERVSQRTLDRGISCTSMVVTVFGDSISQHGDWIWLGSLIKALAPFGYNERLVRTAVFRLGQQGWLEVKKIGRRSYYCPTDSARSHNERADRRIYSVGQEAWDGSWTLVVPVFVPDEKKDSFRKSLLWQGYNSLLSGMFAHPSFEEASLQEILLEQDLVGKVIVFSASTEDLQSQAALKELVLQKWNFLELQDMYREFLAFYRPMIKSIDSGSLTPQMNFLLRTLMIHEYRRVLLRDPDFPDAMLPSAWVGFEARDVVKRLYSVFSKDSSHYIENALENAQGPMPGLSANLYKRFAETKI